PAPTTRRILMECTDCGRPGRPEHLPDGLCRPCRTTHTAEAPAQPAEVPEVADIKARMANLRDLLKPV
ncbi:MarR family transcriptional regulator, partial [Streptomyces sp. DSM 41640]|nr:MarR family transcriptional regulator [Streptomyces sp. DSM 41640]